MSSTSRVRRSSPAKHGPMRATIPMASLLRHSGGLRKSPTLSPTSNWRCRASPENSSSGQRSPGSITYKAKSKTLSTCTVNSGSVIRRTASLDTIYLKGQWPRDNFYMHSGLLQVDKATQTEDANSVLKVHRLTSDTTSSTDDKLEKLFRQRLQRSTKDGSTSGRERFAAYGLVHQSSVSECSAGSQTILPSPTTKASPVNIPTMKPMVKPPMRSSIEGLNQEIERLVLKGGLQAGAPCSLDRSELDKYQQVTPEGHRAPLADLLRCTRSVNTQTPAASDFTGSCQSSGPSSRDSASPLIPGHLDVSRPPSDQGSQGSSPDQEGTRLGTSPHINRFLAREPPDGCERVNLRFLEDTKQRPVADYCPLKPCVTFQLKPSLGSAFYPLHPVADATEGGKSSSLTGDRGYHIDERRLLHMKPANYLTFYLFGLDDKHREYFRQVVKMGKIMKSGKVVLVLSGRYAGRKAIIMKNFDDGTSDKQYGHAMIAGIDRYPRKVHKRMGKTKIHKRSKIKPFIKIMNYNHLMPTRYSVDLALDQKYSAKDMRDPMKRKKAKFQTRVKFEERYKSGKNKWFFQKLRF
ncbi:Ribosomal protein L27 [Carabus blaptoides fortunei]